MAQYMKFARCDYIDFALVLQRHIAVRNIMDMQLEDEQISDWQEQVTWLIYDNQLKHLQSIHISQATSDQFLYQPDTLALVRDERTARLYRQQEGGLVLLDTILTLPQQHSSIVPLPTTNREFLAIGRNTLQLLDSRMQMRCRVQSSCNPSDTRVFPFKDNSFLLTTSGVEESWTAIYSASNLQLLKVLPSFNIIASLWTGLAMFESEGTIGVYNINTNRTLAALKVNQPEEYGLSVGKYPNQEFAMINRSRVMVYSGISDEPKYNINTNDDKLEFIYYWEDNNKIVVCSSDTVYLIDLKQEEERSLLNGEVPAFAAM